MITAQDIEIRSLVDDIRDGTLLLPELQRGYVWKSSQVRELFDSLYRGYPSGQLLIWETDDLPYARPTHVDGVAPSQRRPQLLLDGQQRLTSLSAIMLGRDLAVRDATRSIDIVFNVYTEIFAVANAANSSAETGWVSLKRLFTEGQVPLLQEMRLAFNDPQMGQVFDRLRRLENIQKYTYRVNLLRSITYDEVTDIFIRINSAGTVLSNADLALAQISSRWRGVTEALSAYQATVRERHAHVIDTGTLLRTLSLLLTNQSRLSAFFRGGRHQITVDELQHG